MPSRPVRLLHIVGTDVGGSWFFDQVDTLSKRGHDVLVVVPGEGPLTSRLRTAGISTVVIPFKGGSIRSLPRVIRAQLSMVRTAWSFRPEIVHTHLLKAVLMGRIAGFLARVPIRISQHPGSLHLEARRLRVFDRATLWIDNVVIGSCEDIASRYRVLGAKKVAVSYYGCHVEDIDPKATGECFRTEYQIEESQAAVGMVAHMYRSGLPQYRDVGIKGHEVFLDAARIVVERFPETRFFVVGDELLGDGRYKASLEERATRLGLHGSVVFTGHRNDVPQVMAAMDVLVNPSLSESASYTMIEALLLERGVVASNVGGLPDTVQDEETGLLVPPKDACALAEAMVRLLTDPEERSRMGRLGRKRTLVKYDIEKTVDSLEDIYEEAIAARCGTVIEGAG